MKKYILAIGLITLLIGVGLSFQNNQVQGNRSDLERVYMTKGGGSSTMSPVATTTDSVTSVAVNATTTFPIYTERADMLIVNYQFTASTSGSRLGRTVEVSNDNKDCVVTPTTCNWFFQEGPSSTSGATITVASTTGNTVFESFIGANATSSNSFVISTMGYRFVRISFGVNGAAGSIWAEATRKVQRP